MRPIPGKGGGGGGVLIFSSIVATLPSVVAYSIFQRFSDKPSTGPALHFFQENKHRIGLDSFPSCIMRTAGPKQLKILQLFIIGS